MKFVARLRDDSFVEIAIRELTAEEAEDVEGEAVPIAPEQKGRRGLGRIAAVGALALGVVAVARRRRPRGGEEMAIESEPAAAEN